MQDAGLDPEGGMFPEPALPDPEGGSPAQGDAPAAAFGAQDDGLTMDAAVGLDMGGDQPPAEQTYGGGFTWAQVTIGQLAACLAFICSHGQMQAPMPSCRRLCT